MTVDAVTDETNSNMEGRMARRFSSITVGELKELLEDQDDDKIVTFASDYGDYVHTYQVHRLRGEIEEEVIEESGYSQSGWALVSTRKKDRLEEEGNLSELDDEEEYQKILIIS